ncbi:MAG: hypothetical protein ABEJ56_03080 [Candidatus Nanohaloarchaea archaeon]
MPKPKDFLQPKQISAKEKQTYEQKFQQLRDDLESNEKMFDSLHDYFSSKNYSPKTISQYYDTYWKWYVELTWDNYYSFEKETFLNTFSHQLPTMTALGIDISEKFMNFFTFNLDEENERESFFQDVKEAVKNLDYPINPTFEDSMNINKALQFYSKKENKEDLEMADFYSKVSEQLFSEDYQLKEFEGEEQRGYITGFLEILFFIKNQDRIHPTTQSYRLNKSGFYEWANRRSDELTKKKRTGMEEDAKKEETEQREAEDSSQQDSQEDSTSVQDILGEETDTKDEPEKGRKERSEQESEERSEVEKESEPETQQAAAAQVKQAQKSAESSQAQQAKQNVQKHKGMTDMEIKKELEDQFGKIESLDPGNIDSFRRVLENTAKQEGREDEASDWFYFDQESGSFKWNI